MKIKQIPEDFIVEEIMDLKIELGPYHYYILTKKNRNTLDIIQEIKKRIGDVGFAGIKDKHALTSQYISVKNKIFFSLDNATFTYLGTGKEWVYMGKLTGNKFTITVRDLEKKLKPVKKIVNYYGEQRFGGKNAEIGKMLLQKNFKYACDALHLDVKNNDAVGALKKQGIHKLKFYVHAYQSSLWNILAIKSKKKVIPILGYLTEGHAYDTLMKKERIKKEDFLIRSIPEISSEGGKRERMILIKKFKTMEFTDDELNPGKKKQVVQFFLPKGAYATIALDNLLTV